MPWLAIIWETYRRPSRILWKIKGFSVVRDLVGHGIGRKMHEEPQVPNYGKPGTGIELKEGLVMAIEPMINAGRI